MPLAGEATGGRKSAGAGSEVKRLQAMPAISFSSSLRYRSSLRAGSRRGMTLVELMVVLAIIVLMASMAVGVFVSIKTGTDENSRQIQLRDLILQARASAVYSHGAAKVVIDNRERKVTCYTIVPMGMWCMEEIDGGIVKGAQGYDGMGIGIGQCPGKYGQAAEFMPTGGRGGAITLPAGPFEIDDGIRLEAWVNVFADNDAAAFRSDQTIIEKSGSYYLQVCATGTIKAGTPSGWVESSAKIASNAWFKLTAQMDRHEYVIYINDALVARRQLRPEDLATSADQHGPLGDCAYGQMLTIGSRNGSFQGAIDEVRIWSVNKEQEFQLESGLGEEHLEHNTAPLNAIYFSPDGSLDSRFHLSPATLSYERNGYLYSVTIGRLGVVEKMDSVPVANDAGPAAPAAPAVVAPPANPAPAKKPAVVAPPSPPKPVAPAPKPPASATPPADGGATPGGTGGSGGGEEGFGN